MSKKRPILFEEKQGNSIYVKLGLPALVVLIIISQEYFTPNPDFDIKISIAVTIFMVGLVFALVSIKLITRIDDEKISIRRRFSMYSEIFLKRLRIKWNHESALSFCFCAFPSREPHTLRLEML